MVVVNKAESQDKDTFISFPSGTAPAESLKRIFTLILAFILCTLMCGSRGGGGTGVPDPPEKSQKYRVH